jgi:hypothetical protein
MSWPISGDYTGNGSTTNRTITVSILSAVYNGFVSDGVGSNIRGINGSATNSFTVAPEQNLNGVKYYYVVFGPRNS